MTAVARFIVVNYPVFRHIIFVYFKNSNITKTCSDRCRHQILRIISKGSASSFTVPSYDSFHVMRLLIQTNNQLHTKIVPNNSINIASKKQQQPFFLILLQQKNYNVGDIIIRVRLGWPPGGVCGGLLSVLRLLRLFTLGAHHLALAQQIIARLKAPLRSTLQMFKKICFYIMC